MESFSWIVVIGMVVLAVEGTVLVLVSRIVLLLSLAALVWSTVLVVCSILWRLWLSVSTLLVWSVSGFAIFLG